MSRLRVAPPRTERMTTRDGTVLVADIWTPAESGPFPVLLMRQAYGRKIGTSLCYAPPAWYAAQGFIVVLQDVRGRGDSGGDFDLFRNEAADGADSVAWAAQLPDSNGRVGMFGFSFQGTNQLLALSEFCPALRAVAPAMIGWDLRRDWAYENGAFALRTNLGWATQLAAESARRAGDHAAQAKLFATSRAHAFSDPCPAQPPMLKLLESYSHYRDWMEHPEAGPYWDAISPAAHLSAIVENAPAVFLIGGWYDSHLPGTLAAWHALRGRVPTRLVVGPWAHFPWDRRLGALDFGADSITTIDQQQVAWFRHWLQDKPPPLADTTLLFDMGACVWRATDGLDGTATRWWLGGGGRAAIDMRCGTLAETPPDEPSDEELVHDPWRPPAPVGGSFGVPPGPVDRHASDARADVLTFTTTPFARARTLCGAISLQLAVETEAEAFDLHGVLSRVSTTYAAYPLAEGYGSFAAGDGPVTLPMRATCTTIAAGERLRLSVAAACFPAFPINPGTGTQPWNADLAELAVITLRVRTGADGGSVLQLPFSSI